MIKVIVSTALRDLARLGAKIEDYPKTRRGAAVKVLESKKGELQSRLKSRMINHLHKIGPGFASGSQVEQNLNVSYGGYGKGVSALKVEVLNEKAAIIANAWNKGATIRPKSWQFLAQPISEGKRVEIPASSYKGDQYSTWVYKGTKFQSRNPNIEQDVIGLMVIRKKNSFVLGRKLNSKTKKNEVVAVPETVARYILMKKQVIKPTRWAFNALKEFREVDFPVVAKELINEMKSERLT